MLTIIRLALLAFAVLIASPAFAGQSLVWTSLSATGEYRQIDNPASTVFESMYVANRAALEGGTVLAWPGTVCHVWYNRADGVTPAGAPWVRWGTGEYIDLPRLVIYGPHYVFFWCASVNDSRAVYYTLTWTLSP